MAIGIITRLALYQVNIELSAMLQLYFDTAVFRKSGIWRYGPEGDINIKMLAQALAEYGALQAMASAFVSAYNRVESLLIGQGNMKYVLLGALAVIILLLVKRRRL